MSNPFSDSAAGPDFSSGVDAVEHASRTALEQATRGLLMAWDDTGVAQVTASAVWWDGDGLWLMVTQTADSPEAPRNGESAVVLLPATSGRGPVALRGTLRVYGFHDPMALVLHWPAVIAATSALALRGAPGPWRTRARGLSPRQLALRVVAESIEVSARIEAATMTPALPVEVPAEVRRALAGVRQVTMFGPGVAAISNVTWGPGLALDGAGVRPGPAAVIADDGETAGIVLQGHVDAQGVLRPQRVRWWSADGNGHADVRPPGLVMPE